MLQKIGKMVGFLGRLRRSWSESVLNLIYRYLILPLFDYGDIIYSSTFKKHTDKLQKLQNRAGRIILKVKPEHHVSVSEMHNALNWQLLDKRRLDHSLVFMNKIWNDLTPTYLRMNLNMFPSITLPDSVKYYIYLNHVQNILNDLSSIAVQKHTMFYPLLLSRLLQLLHLSPDLRIHRFRDVFSLSFH